MNEIFNILVFIVSFFIFHFGFQNALNALRFCRILPPKHALKTILLWVLILGTITVVVVFFLESIVKAYVLGAEIALLLYLFTMKKTRNSAIREAYKLRSNYEVEKLNKEFLLVTMSRLILHPEEAEIEEKKFKQKLLALDIQYSPFLD